MSNGDPKFSVIIPCFRQGHYLPASVGSVLEQSYPHVEIWVVDDGSPDETPAIAATFGERIRYVRQANQGLAGARNTGIRNATGDWLLFLDADDMLQSDTLLHHARAIMRHREGSVFCGGYQELDDHGTLSAACQPAPSFDPDPYHKLLLQNLMPPVCFTVRRQAAISVGSFRSENLFGHEDWDFWLRLAAGGHLFFPVDQAVSIYRKGQTSMSSNVERMTASGLYVLRSNRGVHKNCPECRWRISEGIRRARRRYLAQLGRRVLGQIGPPLSVPSAIVGLARRVLRDPPMLGTLVFDGLGALVRRRAKVK